MKPRATVLYDGDCAFCTASIRHLRELDWRHRLTFEDARDPNVLAAHPQVSRAAAEERLQLVPHPGAPALEGFHALRWISARLPALWPAWPFLWLPGMTRVGEWIYDRVARARGTFGRCKSSCRVEQGGGADKEDP